MHSPNSSQTNEMKFMSVFVLTEVDKTPQTKVIFYTAEIIFFFTENQESFPSQSPREFYKGEFRASFSTSISKGSFASFLT